MQDLPFQNAFSHSKSNFSTCAVSFSFDILLYIFITCIKWANSSLVFHLLFVTFLVYRYDKSALSLSLSLSLSLFHTHTHTQSFHYSNIVINIFCIPVIFLERVISP